MAWNQPGDDKRRAASRSAPQSASLDEALRRWQGRVQHLWRPGSGRGKAAIALILLAVLAWLASGYYQIGAAERGVVQSFGRYVATEQPGGGWHWPWPIQSMTKLNVANVDAVDSRAMMLSSDQGLLNMNWSVQYRVSNPLQFLFALSDPSATLRQSSETVIRQLAARDSLQELLGGDGRARLSAAARTRIQQLMDGYGAGLEVSSVSLTDVALPDPVMAAQHDAQRAAEDQQHALADARSYADSVALKAQAAAQHQLAEAQIYATQTVAQAQAETERFTQLLSAYTLAPQIMRNRLYIQTMTDILSHVRKIFVDARTGNGTVIYVPLDKLTNLPRGSASPESSATAPADGGAETVPNERRGDDDRSRSRGDR